MRTAPVFRFEVACLALVAGFGLGSLCYRRLRLQALLPLAEQSFNRERTRSPGLAALVRAAPPPPPAPRRSRSKKTSTGLVPGFVFAGIGNLPGDDAPCQGDGQRHDELPPRAPSQQVGALGSMCQPGNVSALQCGQACAELETCLGFVWSPKPPWSKYSECYLKGSCPLGRLRALDGSFSWQKNSTQCASKRKPAWIEYYGD